MKETFALLADQDLDATQICNIVPVNIEHNCTFVVNQSRLAHPDDIRADDCGVWKNNGVRPCVVTWKNKEATIVARGAKKCRAYTMKSADFVIQRTYFVHNSYEDFRRVISVIEG